MPRADIAADALSEDALRTFCPYKGVASYYDIGGVSQAAWSHRAPMPEVSAIAELVSFEPDKVEVTLDGERLRLEPGQRVTPHGLDRNLVIDEAGGLLSVS